jgi:hypothetical protein
MTLKKVYNTNDELLAYSVRDLLLQNGVPALLRTYDGLAMAGIAPEVVGGFADVEVEAEDYERALELIGGFLGTLGELKEAGDENPPDAAEQH